MINKIHISNWQKGDRNTNRQELQNTLMSYFVQTIKSTNPDLEIVYLCDTQAYNSTPLDVKNNVTTKLDLDQYNHFESSQWPLVKLLGIANVAEDKIFHLDFDILWKYDLKNIFKLIEDSQIDCLYQCWEMLDAPHKYYIDFLKQYPETQNILTKVTNKVAYNAGISFYSSNAKLRLQEILNSYPIQSFLFKYCAGFEQVLIPNLLITEGYKVKVLANLLSQLPLVDGVINIPDTFGNQNDQYFKDYCKSGAFLGNIKFYHFLGDCKDQPHCLEYINYIYNNL